MSRQKALVSGSPRHPDLAASPFPFLSWLSLTFGLGFGLGGAGLGHADGLLALGIIPRLLQGALAGFGARAPITRPPALKLVLAVRWRESARGQIWGPSGGHKPAQVSVRLPPPPRALPP
ncbi:unnamed protein product, partial [Gulo gulo]